MYKWFWNYNLVGCSCLVLYFFFHFVEYVSPANWPKLVYVCLTINPRARIDSESIAQEAEGRMGY